MAIYKNIFTEDTISVKENGIKSINIGYDSNSTYKHGPRYKVIGTNHNYEIPMNPNTCIPDLGDIKGEIPDTDTLKYICGLSGYAKDEIKLYISSGGDDKVKEAFILKGKQYVRMSDKDKKYYSKPIYDQAIRNYEEERKKGKGRKL